MIMNLHNEQRLHQPITFTIGYRLENKHSKQNTIVLLVLVESFFD